MSSRVTTATPSAARELAAAGTVGTGPNFDPGALISAVEEGSARLEAAADQLHNAVVKYERAEADYERALQMQLIVIYHRAKESGERMPAEDVRNALAHQAINNEIYAEYLSAKAEKEALQVRYRALQASVSARQSVLKALTGMGG